MPHLEMIEVVLVHYNIVNNDYQQDSRVFFIHNPNKLCIFKKPLIQNFHKLKYG